MNNMTRTLFIVLVVQLALVSFLSLGKSSLSAPVSGQKLLTLDLESIDKIVAEQPDGNSVTVGKVDGNWVLFDKNNFPAARTKIEELKTKLFDLDRPWPVGNTENAARQLQVVDGIYSKKVSLYRGDKLVDSIYLGSSPGFKKVHAKLSSEAPIYSIPFSSHELSVKDLDWADRDFLKVNQADVKKISVNTIRLEKTESGFTVQGLESNEEIDHKAVNALVSRVTSLPFDGILGTENKQEYKQDAPLGTFGVEMATGDTITYNISGPYETTNYVVKASDKPFYVTVGKSSVDSILSATRADLVKAKKDAEPAESASTGEASSLSESSQTVENSAAEQPDSETGSGVAPQ